VYPNFGNFQNLLRKAFFGAGVALLHATGALAADPETGPYSIFFAGQMTGNTWEEVFSPRDVNFLDSWFLGAGLGYEWTTRFPRTTLGLEAQAARHFGRQDHFEFNMPVIVRYYPRRPIFSSLDSVSFGIGLSTASKDPQVEIDRDGETSKTLIYWMGELDFALSSANFSIRLHHRSDAYGLFATDSGSNAIAFGIKKKF
jgi:hypothetical protein